MRLGGQDLAPPSQPGQMDRGRLQRIALMAVGALMAGAPLFPFTVSFRSTAYTQALPVRSLCSFHRRICHTSNLTPRKHCRSCRLLLPCYALSHSSSCPFTDSPAYNTNTHTITPPHPTLLPPVMLFRNLMTKNYTAETNEHFKTLGRPDLAQTTPLSKAEVLAEESSTRYVQCGSSSTEVDEGPRQAVRVAESLNR